MIRTPIYGLLSTVLLVIGLVGAFIAAPQCDTVYRSCEATCARLDETCGVPTQACIAGCNALDATDFASMTECVWPSKSCEVALACWPNQADVPWSSGRE
ncbi:MAG: hypothetical protein VX589_15935 [Myxococcota bacterium]|nr:hypothetical protein [Myxococcota bacterium]